MGTQPVEAYCREVETYLCRKNDGHLIRVVGPSFDLVSGWAADGIPLNVAFRGIDRCFERYHRRAPRRRPLRIDFCEADVLDAFDEWRRALGLTASVTASGPRESEEGAAPGRRGPSLPAHLERAVRRLTEARAGGALGAAFDGLIDCVAHELERACAERRSLRGERRQELLARLSALDVEMLQAARASLDGATRASLAQEADGELAAFRSSMAPEAFTRVREAAIDRLVRAQLGLPVLSFV